MRLLSVSLLAAVLDVAPLTAQVRADPGVVIGKRVAVRVTVTLADDDTPYYPVRGYAVRFAPSAGDTTTARTDEAGVVTVLLVPGRYVVAAANPVQWKGTWYTWSVPVDVRADMGAVELDRTNATVARTGARVARAPTTPPRAGSSGEVRDASTRRGPIPWLSIEAGGEGGLTRARSGGDSDAGYGGSGAFVGGLGPLALAIGYRYTSIRFGGDLDPGSMRTATAELRYHLRPGSAPVRPYVAGFAAYGRWYDSGTLGGDDAPLRMFGGSVGAQFGLATSVRLHVAATVAGTRISMPGGTTDTGLFATGTLGLTFDIFSPAR